MWQRDSRGAIHIYAPYVLDIVLHWPPSADGRMMISGFNVFGLRIYWLPRGYDHYQLGRLWRGRLSVR